MPSPRPPLKPGSASTRSGSQTPSRASSAHGAVPYTPLTPSQLRMSHEPGTSPKRTTPTPRPGDGQHSPFAHVEGDSFRPVASEPTSPFTGPARMAVDDAVTEASSGEDVDAHTGLLQSCNAEPGCGLKRCNHGTFSPRPTMRKSYLSFDGQGLETGNSMGGRNLVPDGDPGTATGGWTLGGGGKGKRLSTTQLLARRHGVKNSRAMYGRFSNILHMETRFSKISPMRGCQHCKTTADGNLLYTGI